MTFGDDILDMHDLAERMEELASKWLESQNDDGEPLTDDERAEVAALESLQEQLSKPLDEAADDDPTLILDSYFQRYAQELAEDLEVFSVYPDNGYGSPVDVSSRWPFTCIDWRLAARELQMDYTSVEIAGYTYWTRAY